MGEKRYIISDASKMLNVESHVLRYWEEELEIKVPRNEMGHRYYTESNIEILSKVRDYKNQGYSLKAIKNMIGRVKNAKDRLTVRQPISLMEIREKRGDNLCNGNVFDNSQNMTDICEKEGGDLCVSSEKQLSNDSKANMENTTNIKMEQFQNLMNKIVSNALKESTEGLGKELSDNVSENVLKGMNYMMRVQEEKEEERYKKLDELMRSKQKISRQEKRKKIKAEKMLLKKKKKGTVHIGKKLTV